ncbi:MAG: S1C family serine protease [Nitrospiria bacterium]
MDHRTVKSAPSADRHRVAGTVASRLIFPLLLALFYLVIIVGPLRAEEAPRTYSFQELVAIERRTVVNIRSEEVARNGGGPLKDYFRLGKHLSDKVKNGSLGTGFIIDSTGLVLTNYHVVTPPPRYQEARGIRVRLFDGREFPAKVIGRDKKTDVALLRIENGGRLFAVTLGDSEGIDIGEWVMAIGNAFGIEESVSVGVVSGTGRVLGAGPYDQFIQTDAVIHAGNTGGPLYNIRGEVIGMNTTVSVTGYGIGFAIPINVIKNMLSMLENDGQVTRGWLGVMIQTLTPDLARVFKLDDKRGALVSEVMPKSPAKDAGLQRGDVILTFDGKTVNKMRDLPTLVAETPVGKTVSIDLVREGQRMEMDVTVRAMALE